MRLSNFIRSNIEVITNDWESFARTLAPSKNITRRILRDHIKEILNFIIKDIDAPQTVLSQIEKSKTHGSKVDGISAAEAHANLRLAIGFNVAELAAEYRALRANITKLWTNEWTSIDPSDFTDLVRFNEAIDQELMESIVKFKEKIERAKDVFIGILSHDLRSPLGAISMSSQLILEGKLNEKQTSLAVAQIKASSEHMGQMITDLLDLTRINLGAGIPITKTQMDISITGKKVVEEIKAAYPNSVILFESTGNVEGLWDSSRIAQVFSNLIINAIQHGSDNLPITVKVTGKSDEVIISVHNVGNPIPKGSLLIIFNNLARLVKDGEKPKESSSLGLGLYITREIVTSHGGNIHVTSSHKDGTTFTVYLPRGLRQIQKFQAAA